MEWLSTILVNGDLMKIGGLLIVVAVLIYIFIKKGILKMKVGGVSLGNADTERKIMRMQNEYLSTVIKGYYMQIVKEHGTDFIDKMRFAYVSSIVKDFMQEIIMYNHISDDDEYIKMKQLLLKNLIYGIEGADLEILTALEKDVETRVEDIIKTFVRIRNKYS